MHCLRSLAPRNEVPGAQQYTIDAQLTRTGRQMRPAYSIQSRPLSKGSIKLFKIAYFSILSVVDKQITYWQVRRSAATRRFRRRRRVSVKTF